MCVAGFLQNQYKNTREEGSIPKAFGEDFSGVSESLFCDCNFNDHGGSRELMATFRLGLETGSEVCCIALWDCYGRQI